MNFTIPSNNLPISLVLGIRARNPAKISIVGMDGYKPNTCYIQRDGIVRNYREFELQFPQSPQVMLLSVFNADKGNMPEDNSFEIVNFDVKGVKTYPLWQDKNIHNFVEFAQRFCANASILSAGEFKPSTYRSDNGKFSIDYFYKIRDRSNKSNFINTPARIGHSTGIIEVSKSDFDKYTVPMRMIILLHEFSHKYMNPKINRDISDEVAADINACNIYLSLGYPTIEAEYAFAKVFRGADNPSNRQRLMIIDNFIKKFNKGDLQHRGYVSNNTNQLV